MIASVGFDNQKLLLLKTNLRSVHHVYKGVNEARWVNETTNKVRYVSEIFSLTQLLRNNGF